MTSENFIQFRLNVMFNMYFDNLERNSILYHIAGT
jgi:hypothetical protein